MFFIIIDFEANWIGHDVPATMTYNSKNKTNTCNSTIHTAHYYCRDCVKPALYQHELRVFGPDESDLTLNKLVETHSKMNSANYNFERNMYRRERIEAVMDRITGSY
jgi:hypothetical protein